MARAWLGTVGLGLLIVGACSSNSNAPRGQGKLVEVSVNVFAMHDASVAAVLIDRNGRRTGWNPKGSLDEIAGCTLESGSEDGIPVEVGSDSARGTVAMDRAPATPIYHFFHIFNDAVTPVGLIDQGGCELRLDPVAGGRVRLSLKAKGIEVGGCSDTTSIPVRPGVASRWWLSWKTTGGRCVAKISALEAKKAGGAPK